MVSGPGPAAADRAPGVSHRDWQCRHRSLSTIAFRVPIQNVNLTLNLMTNSQSELSVRFRAITMPKISLRPTLRVSVTLFK